MHPSPLAAERPFPLAMAGRNATVRIVGFDGGVLLRHKVSALGLVRGARVEVLHRHGGGRMVLAVGDARVAIGVGMAHKILVSPLSDVMAEDTPR